MYNLLKMHALKVFRQSLKTNKSELEIRRTIKELRALDDRDLDDLGLSRGTIEHAVRYGRTDDNAGAPIQRVA